MIGWYTTTVDNNSQDHESNTTCDFHYAKNKFDLTQLAADTDRPWVIAYLSIASDSKELDDYKGEKQWYDPSAVVDILYIRPKVYDLAGVSDLIKHG
jgi:hypothetical protein